MRYRASKLDCADLFAEAAVLSECAPPSQGPAPIHEGARDVARDIAKHRRLCHLKARAKEGRDALRLHLKRILKLDRLRLRGDRTAPATSSILAAAAQNLRKLRQADPAIHPNPGHVSPKPLVARHHRPPLLSPPAKNRLLSTQSAHMRQNPASDFGPLRPLFSGPCVEVSRFPDGDPLFHTEQGSGGAEGIFAGKSGLKPGALHGTKRTLAGRGSGPHSLTILLASLTIVVRVCSRPVTERPPMLANLSPLQLLAREANARLDRAKVAEDRARDLRISAGEHLGPSKGSCARWRTRAQELGSMGNAREYQAIPIAMPISASQLPVRLIPRPHLRQNARQPASAWRPHARGWVKRLDPGTETPSAFASLAGERAVTIETVKQDILLLSTADRDALAAWASTA